MRPTSPSTLPSRSLPRAGATTALAVALLLAAPLVARAGSHRHSSDDSDADVTILDDSSFGWTLYDPVDGSITCNNRGEDGMSVLETLRNERTRAWCFQRDGRNFVVRDADFVRRAFEISAPMRELAQRQGELGAHQGALGGRQGAFGAKQAALAMREAALARRIAAIESGDDERSGRDELRELRDRVRDLQDEQRELQRQQAPISREQGEYGRRQGELGREQARVSRQASEAMEKLADEAMRTGKAAPLLRHRSV